MSVCEGFNWKSPTELLEGLGETGVGEQWEQGWASLPSFYPYPNRLSDTCQRCNEPPIGGSIQAQRWARA